MSKSRGKALGADEQSATELLENAPYNVQGAQQAYLDFLPEARALAPEELIAFRGNTHLALQNIHVGVKAIVAHEDRIRDDLNNVHLEAIKRLPELGKATEFAVLMVDRKRRPPVTAKTLFKEAWPLRTLLLNTAEVLVHMRLLPNEDVQKIRQGRGLLDTARDLIELAALYTKYADRLQGKTPIEPEQIEKAAVLGSQLLDVLKAPINKQPSDLPKSVQEAIDIRNRFWTLLSKYHKELRRVGMWLWMDEVNEHIPPLKSREPVRKRKPSKKPGPAKKPNEDSTLQKEQSDEAQPGAMAAKPADAKPIEAQKPAAAASTNPQAPKPAAPQGPSPASPGASASAATAAPKPAATQSPAGAKAPVASGSQGSGPSRPSAASGPGAKPNGATAIVDTDSDSDLDDELGAA